MGFPKSMGSIYANLLISDRTVTTEQVSSLLIPHPFEWLTLSSHFPW